MPDGAVRLVCSFRTLAMSVCYVRHGHALPLGSQIDLQSAALLLLTALFRCPHIIYGHRQQKAAFRTASTHDHTRTTGHQRRSWNGTNPGQKSSETLYITYPHEQLQLLCGLSNHRGGTGPGRQRSSGLCSRFSMPRTRKVEP